MSSHFDPHLLQFLDDGRLGDVRFRHVNTNPAFPVHFLKSPRDTANTEEQHATEISAQRERIRNMVKGTEQRLLELFFELVYPVYPIIDPSQFYAAYNRPGNTDNIDVGVLAGMLAIMLKEEIDSKLVRYMGEGGAAGVAGTDPTASKRKRVPKRPAPPAPLVPIKGVHPRLDSTNTASQLLDPTARSGPALPLRFFANTSNDDNDDNNRKE
ncbi:hypothetical protein DV454_001708 [Geotrichum candidum]|nr:hypothetical protein DV454_001708 [Geotrichum candidum]